MEEIAALAGVSKSTVSRTLHSPHLVHPKTRHSILQLMEERGYVYNATAADLSKKKSTVIGVLIPTNRHVAFGTTAFGILEAAEAAGFSVIIANTGFDHLSEERLLRRFCERQVAGLILTGFTPGLESTIRQLSTQALPAVVIWEKLDVSDISYIGFDNYRASCSVTEYLISLGHKDIALIIGPYSKVGRVRKRLEGYTDTLHKHGIHFDRSMVFERDPVMMAGKEAMARLLALSTRPTAVFAASDDLAIGAMAAAREAGLRIPEDISVAGFDDVDYASYSNPPLTTVRVPAYEMGKMAVEFLSQVMSGKAGEVRQYCLDTDLIIRHSCAPLQTKAY